MGPHRSIIAKANEHANTMPNESGWARRHNYAWRKGEPIARLIEAAADYADKHLELCGSPIGDDYVLGPEWAAILFALRGLLNGDLGQLDGGTCDRILSSMLAQESFNPDIEGERLDPPTGMEEG